METCLVKILATMVCAAWARARVPTAKYMPRRRSVGRPMSTARTTAERRPGGNRHEDRQAGFPKEVGDHGAHAEEGHDAEVHLARVSPYDVPALSEYDVDEERHHDVHHAASQVENEGHEDEKGQDGCAPAYAFIRTMRSFGPPMGK